MSFPKDLVDFIEDYTPSDTPVVPIGTYCKYGGRTWVYGKAKGTIGPNLGVKNGLCQGVANCVVGADAAIGDKAVVLTTAATDGAAGTGLIVENEFAGGYLVLFKANAGSTSTQVRKITGNTARAATGSVDVTFYIDVPLTVALVEDTDYGEAMQNPWSYLVHDVEIGHPVVGVPTALATTGQYLWIQTDGPVWVSPQAACGIAGATGLYWRHDGSVDVENADAYVSDQYAGYVLAESSTHTQAAPFFMMKCSP